MKKPEAEIRVKVRFSDTDAMGVVWHGNYLRFFEDGREAFGRKYNLEYLDMYNNGFFIPIVKSSTEHKSTVNYGEEIKVITRFIPSPAAKIIFEYEVHNLATGKLSATGKTTQIFMNSKTRGLELTKPGFFSDWEEKMGIWQPQEMQV